MSKGSAATTNAGASSPSEDDLPDVRAEERYQAFIHNSSEGIWRAELDTPISVRLAPEQQIKQMYERGYLAEANESMARMYGFPSPSPLIGLRLDKLLVQDDSRNTEYLKAFVTSGYSLSGVESHEVDKDGNAKYFRNSLVGIVENGKLVRAWGTQQDVTEQHQAAEALKKSEETLALALAVSQTGLWEWDLKARKLKWSSELKEIFGLPTDAEVTYKDYIAKLEPEGRTKMQQIIKQAVKSGATFQVEHRIKWPDGSKHWVQSSGQAFLENGKPVRMLGTTRNIDGRKAAEMRLQESEARFRSTADTAPVLIWISGLDKKYTYFNKPWLEFTGRTLKQELGDGWAENVYADDRARCQRIHDLSFDKRQPFQMEYRLRRADGEYRWVLDSGRPRFSPDGVLLGYIGSCMDIHDFKLAVERRKELETRTRALTEQREHLMALNSAKDEFISLASHQLRTPATAVKQYVGMLLEGYAGDLTDEQRELLDLAFSSNERQISIVNDLLKVAHVDAGRVTIKKEPADLVRIVADVTDEQAPNFKNREQDLSVTLPKRPLTAVLDASKIRMVIENILDNASKYTPSGKRITVALNRNQQSAYIIISDDGVGIAKRDLPKLFQKFSRINNERSTEVGGSGLGLYWAKKIMDLHGGTIAVESKLHHGTTFTITIPRETA
jgi:PAS domain S-box-containing protein